MDVFNAHLSLTAPLRRRQIERLLATQDVLRLDPHHPCIIGGDMNDWYGSLKTKLLAPAGFRCATSSRPDTRWTIRTFPSFAPAGALDRVYFRGKMKLLHVHRSRLNLARVASDHLPVIADFDL